MILHTTRADRPLGTNPKTGAGEWAPSQGLELEDGRQSQELVVDSHPLEGVLESAMPAVHFGIKTDYLGSV